MLVAVALAEHRGMIARAGFSARCFADGRPLLGLVAALALACSETPAKPGAQGGGTGQGGAGASGAAGTAGAASGAGGAVGQGGTGGTNSAGGASGAAGAGGTPGGAGPTGGSAGSAGAGSGGAAGAGAVDAGGAGAPGGASGASGAMSGGGGSGGEGGTDGVRWVGTWATAPQLTETSNLPPSPGLSNNTLRQIFYVSIGGSRLRVHFSNAYGNGPLTMNAVQLARSTSGHGVDTASGRALAFSGSPSVTVPAGGTISSDPFDFDLPAQTKVALTIAFGSTPSDVTGHPGSRTTSYIATGNAASAAMLSSPVTTEHWYYATGIDVTTDAASGAVVTLGDSITDGRGSTTDNNNRWPDNLSRRLRANAATAAIAVLNQGIGGNAVLTGGLGPTGQSRFERDVLDQAGVRFVIVLHGVNDIGAASSQSVAQDLIGAYQAFVSAARARDILAYGVPILPFAGSQYDTPDHEAARQTVNTWIRSPGNFDAVIDLDAAVRDSANPARLQAAYDSGDGLHLNPAGYQRMADAIDLALFSP